MPTDSISSCQCPGRYGRDEIKRTRTRINPFIKRIAVIHESKGRIRQKDYTLKELHLDTYMTYTETDCLEFRKTETLHFSVWYFSWILVPLLMQARWQHPVLIWTFLNKTIKKRLCIVFICPLLKLKFSPFCVYLNVKNEVVSLNKTSSYIFTCCKIIFKTTENLDKYLQDMDIFKGENFNSDSLYIRF